MASPLPRFTADCGEYGFPRDARLLNASDYSMVFKKSKRRADLYWSVLVHNCGNDPARLGLAIAKKRARRAVDRNLLKRIAREVFRNRRHTLKGHHLVIMNREAAASASRSDLHQSLDRLLATVGNSQRV